MNEIARYTTPTITFKPSAAEVENIDEIFLVVKQYGSEVFRMDKDDAVVEADGFTWFFGQTDTSKLTSSEPSTVQIDYTSGTARYTTRPRLYIITESAINEVI